MTQAEITRPTVVLDQGHGNLIDPSPDAPKDESFSELISLLQQEDVGFQIGDPITGRLKAISLSGVSVYAFAAPTGQLTGDEISYIWSFIRDGGGLLLLNNARAFQYQVYSLNALAEQIGCRFGFYAANQPLTLRNFATHFISGNVAEVEIGNSEQQILSRISLVGSEVKLQPIVRNGYSALLAIGTYGKGRIVVAGNTTLFSNEYIAKSDNKKLALNIFRWLARVNPFEFEYLTPQCEVELGQYYIFEIGLYNPTNQAIKIEEVVLDSSVNDKISQRSIQDIVLYPDKDGTDIQKLRWEIEPQDILGDHNLRLQIRLEQDETVYRHVANFTVVMPGHSLLTVRKREDDIKRDIFVGDPFEVIGTGAMSNLKEKAIAFTPELDFPAEHIRQIRSTLPSALQWTLVARTAGTFPIALRIKETGQLVQTNIVVKESNASQIETIRARFIRPLEDEIRRILPRLSSELTAPVLAEVSFKLLTIEDYISIAFPFEPAAQQVSDVVEAGYWEESENELVVADLLYNLAPMFMPRNGAFVPFAPDLVSHLIKNGTSRRKELLVNFLKGNEVTEVQMRRQIASYLSHEKYGHGFFYTRTKLGQQLTILDKHKFLDKYAEHILRRPYPQKLYDRYRQVIKILQHSTLIANEGFAAWLELKILERMDPEIHAIIPEREAFMQKATTLHDVKRDSSYFDKFPPASGLDSPYEEGRQYLESIEKLYPEEYGIKCAIQAFLVATYIPLGISDGDEAPDFALTTDTLESALLEEGQGRDARSDLRLWRIGRVLEDTRESVRTVQEQLQCHSVCLHPECPVRAQIAEKLGWRADND